MNSNTLLILGDSTSMSIGLERKMYPFKLADAHIWPSGTKIVNCSLPGFTSADAAAFFFRHQSLWRNDLRAVLMYLGNCDTTSSEVRKGRYGYRQQAVNKVREVFGITPSKVKLKNRLLHYEWNNTWDPTIESPEHPEDFEFNIERIIRACQQADVPTILIRPKANRHFLPGIGKGNFVFYRFINAKDQIADTLQISDGRFKEALRLQESGHLKAAADAYKEILLKPSSAPMSQEYAFVVVNNFAAVKAEAGDFEEARYLLQLLLKERGIRKEIILYNLAQIQKNCGDQQGYATLMADSYEVDDSLYRIRSPYLRALDHVAGRHPMVQIVDMETVIPDALYLDHCHPLPEGQTQLATEIIACLERAGVRGNATADISNILYNPELARGNVLRFHEYFKTAATLSESQIATAIVQIRENLETQDEFDSSSAAFASIPQEILNAINYYLRHPCFPTIRDIMNFPPCYPTDVGRFPEYFLIRHLIPYLRAHESNPSLASRFSPALGLLHSAEAFISILPDGAIPFVEPGMRHIEATYEKARLASIVSKVRRLLALHLRAKCQIYERTKSTIFWYVRETLRFGAHSRYSMLYDRVLMEFLAEGLAVAGVLDAATGMESASEIEEMIRILQSVVQVHEEYCSQFSLTENAEQLLVSYDGKLMEFAGQLEAVTTEKI